MSLIPQIIFLLLMGIGSFLFLKRIRLIQKSIQLGRADLPNDQPVQRMGQVLRLALGQQKMFRNIPVAILHLVIYAGFIIINIEVLEIVLDGLTGAHRIFLQPMGSLYPTLINAFEWLA
ncbi:MAG: hypothetical protein RL750_180, partial [Bacteroidota bacterium]